MLGWQGCYDVNGEAGEGAARVAFVVRLGRRQAFRRSNALLGERTTPIVHSSLEVVGSLGGGTAGETPAATKEGRGGPGSGLLVQDRSPALGWRAAG